MAVDLRVSIISGRLSAALEYSHFSINDPSSHLRESFLTPPGPRNTQGGTRKRRLFHRELGLRFQNAGTLEEGSLRCEKNILARDIISVLSDTQVYRAKRTPIHQARNMDIE